MNKQNELYQLILNATESNKIVWNIHDEDYYITEFDDYYTIKLYLKSNHIIIRSIDFKFSIGGEIDELKDMIKSKILETKDKHMDLLCLVLETKL